MNAFTGRPIAPLLLLTSSLIVIAYGCGQVGNSPPLSAKDSGTATPNGTPTQVTAPDKATGPPEEHAHKPGAHGGMVVSIGLDSYHAEALFEKGGGLKLLMLGKDESRILEVESQKLKAYVKASGGSEAVAIDIAPAPQEGDSEGKTSQFLGQLPAELTGQEVDVTIPSIRINGERFRIGFTSKAEDHSAADGAMPSSVSASDEKELYLTAAGKYTTADIAANGNVTASQKFKGIVSNHNLKPVAGDKICPVTLTKANPKFSWVIDGQEYQFCCPPCVDEYVKLAKESPDDLKPADSFVKK